AVYEPGEDPEAFDPRQFIIRAEDYGIPQARHRVILVGIRDDGFSTPRIGQLHPSSNQVPLEIALRYGLPELRSGLSRQDKGVDHWKAVIEEAFVTMRQDIPGPIARAMEKNIRLIKEKEFREDRGSQFVST